jgi:hypothetical protein
MTAIFLQTSAISVISSESLMFPMTAMSRDRGGYGDLPTHMAQHRCG